MVLFCCIEEKGQSHTVHLLVCYASKHTIFCPSGPLTSHFSCSSDLWCTIIIWPCTFFFTFTAHGGAKAFAKAQPCTNVFTTLMTFVVEIPLEKRSDVIFQIFGDPGSRVRYHGEDQHRRQIATATENEILFALHCRMLCRTRPQRPAERILGEASRLSIG